ncbi:MAG: IS1595 family transposase [Rhodothermaceae bacterium]|nr:IS1595 family transposase [Rhodothermaceae bacterium]
MLGRYSKTGITQCQQVKLFPDEEAAVAWFESIVWPWRRKCPCCGGKDRYGGTHKTMPYRCRPCKRFFSVPTGETMQRSKLPLKTRAYAIYLELTSLKGVFSIKLRRDLGIKLDTAWHVLHRIRMSFIQGISNEFAGRVEVEGSYVGGLEMQKRESKKLKAGRVTVGKAAVASIGDRATGKMAAQVAEDTTAATLRGFVYANTKVYAEVHTDDTNAYEGMIGVQRATVIHSVGPFEDGQVSVSGAEPFWAAPKRAYQGVYPYTSKKHLHRYVTQFAGKHNVRHMDTLHKMQHVVAGIMGRRLMYKELVAK